MKSNLISILKKSILSFLVIFIFSSNYNLAYSSVEDSINLEISSEETIKEKKSDKKNKDIEFFNIDLIDTKDFYELVVRFLFNLLVIFTIARGLYYTISKRKDYLFTYILVSTVVFLLCFLLSNVKLGLGFALGLFAIFGIIRYRTAQIEIKEMTYLFIVIGISVINALANKKISYAELLFTNLAIIGVTWALEKVWLLKHESRKTIIYENIELVRPDKIQELIADLKDRTGLEIHRVEIGKIDYLRDIANIRVYYFENNDAYNAIDDYIIPDDND